MEAKQKIEQLAANPVNLSSSAFATFIGSRAMGWEHVRLPRVEMDTLAGSSVYGNSGSDASRLPLVAVERHLVSCAMAAHLDTTERS